MKLNKPHNLRHLIEDQRNYCGFKAVDDISASTMKLVKENPHINIKQTINSARKTDIFSRINNQDSDYINDDE